MVVVEDGDGDDDEDRDTDLSLLPFRAGNADIGILKILGFR